MEAIEANLYLRVRSTTTHRFYRILSILEVMSSERPTFGLGRASRGTSDVTTTLYYIKSLRGISNFSLQFEYLLVNSGASAQPHRYLFTLNFLFRLH